MSTGMAEPYSGTEEEAVDHLDRLLREVVGRQMIADVPLGAFLSGGIDSSLIVALMQSQSSTPIRTFTIGFDEARFDEAPQAASVARHLGTEHTELNVTHRQALDIIPNLATLYDEPFADSSQVPTCLVAALTRQHVKVSLSGDGGDELFAGYNRYYWGNTIWNRMRSVPRLARRGAAHALTTLSPHQWDRLFSAAGTLLPSALNQRLPGDKLHKLASILPAAEPAEIYHHLVSHWRNPADIVIQGSEPPTTITTYGNEHHQRMFIQAMMYLDLVTYLPDDILVKVDRAGMGVSLETRMPFLDHRVVEFAWQIPLAMKLRNGQGKWLLRQLLYRHVPRELIERPKMGFGIPLDTWLRGPLKEWASTLLEERRLQREGYFNPAPIRRIWHEHLSGQRNWQHHLWDILIFQAWLERNPL
jgi:asparagine synthase (glutamine-hydrolysing)